MSFSKIVKTRGSFFVFSSFSSSGKKVVLITMIRKVVIFCLLARGLCYQPATGKDVWASKGHRRSFLLNQFAVVTAISAPKSVFADEEAGDLVDLEAPEVQIGPSTDEQARISAKLAAQKAAGSAINRKLSAAEALKAEQGKKAAIKSKSKTEAREDLCEMLGRGC